MLCSDAPRFESGGGLTESTTSLRAQAQARPWDAAVGSFREVSPSARSACFWLFLLPRARWEELATRSSTGDGGTGEASLGRGLDGATELSEGLPVGRRRWTADAGAGGSCT